jgi:hypothetical protein
MKDFENIQVTKRSGVKDRLKIYAIKNGRLSFTEAILKLVSEAEENQLRKS